MLRRSWVEINLDTLENNYKIYKSRLPEKLEIMAVIKADAYGHGDMAVAERLSKAGCCNFAVSNISEAINLRNAGAKGQILILGYTPQDAAKQLLEYDITQALLSEDYAERFAGKGIKAQFAIDTGMNRIGIDADDLKACEACIRKYKDKFNLTGLFTHLCVADTESENEFTNEQIDKFKAIVNSVADLNLPYIHCMNTAGGLWHQPYGNLVRLGICMYGLKPDYCRDIPDGIKPALVWKSVISQIKTVHKGETIGYGRTFTADRDMKIATVPTGYADGYSRALSNCGTVIVRGVKVPITGRVCMDQMMIDISNVPDAEYEDEVSLLCDEYTADDMAAAIGTVGYEIICDISKRVPKLYV